MGAVVNETRYIVFGHFGELFLKNTFKAGEDDETFAGIIVVHHSKLNLAGSLLYYSGLSTAYC